LTLSHYRQNKFLRNLLKTLQGEKKEEKNEEEKEKFVSDFEELLKTIRQPSNLAFHVIANVKGFFLPFFYPTAIWEHPKKIFRATKKVPIANLN
jgi:hypothetical protein